MRICNILLLTFALTGFGSPATAEPLRVLDRGMDGETRYYTITCPDGRRSSVSMQYILEETSEPRLKEVCIMSRDGGKCLPQWDLDEAAQASCQ